MHEQPPSWSHPAWAAQLPHIPVTPSWSHGSTFALSSRHLAVVEKAQRRLRQWGILSMIAGSLTAASVVGTGLYRLGDWHDRVLWLTKLSVAFLLSPVAIILLATGVHYLRSARAFAQTRDERPPRAESLLAAIDQLGRALRLEFVVTGGSLAALVIIVALFGFAYAAGLLAPG